MDIFAELEKLRIVHHACDEDCWYSCPKSGDCCNDLGEESCNCGADKHNETLDGIVEWLKSPKDEKRFGCMEEFIRLGYDCKKELCDYDIDERCPWSESKNKCLYWKKII